MKSGQLCLHANEVWRLCVGWATRRCRVIGDSSTWSDNTRAKLRLEMEGLVEHIKIQHIDQKVFREEVEPTGLIAG